MIVEVLKEVPDEIFNGCLTELSKITWKYVVDHRQQGVFETSKSIHLRSHDTRNYKDKPNSIEEFSEITECVDNFLPVLKYPAHYRAANWIKEQVNGLGLGRVMIVNLAPTGTIGIHRDPGPYFEKYSRYHIPFKTDPSVQFFNEKNQREHMPFKTLCRLNNLGYHGLVNNSNQERIHLIVDVEVVGGNTTF